MLSTVHQQDSIHFSVASKPNLIEGKENIEMDWKETVIC